MNAVLRGIREALQQGLRNGGRMVVFVVDTAVPDAREAVDALVEYTVAGTAGRFARQA